MNNKRFLGLLNSGSTEDFYKLGEELRGYAYGKAGGLPDPEDAAYKAWCKIADMLIAGKSLNSWAFVKIIIDHFIIDYRRKINIKLVPNYAESGLDSDKIPGQRKNVLREKAELDETLIDYRVYKGVDEKGFPKDYILEIPNKKEREICKLYWIEDLEQKDIVSELKVTKQYVSRIINKHKSRR